MTRRERYLRILENFGRVGKHDRDRVLSRLGYDAFTDEAIEALTKATVDGHKRHQKNAAASRAIYAAQESAKVLA